LLVASCWAIFVFAPEEATQGSLQKIFYVHLGLVAGMYVPIFFGMLFGILYLTTKKSSMDSLSLACVEVGYLCTTGVLITGSIWAKPVWGAWWTWDPRLTTTLLIWLAYSAYMIVRSFIGNTQQGRQWAAVIAVIAFLDVPLIHYSVRFFRGVHPTVVSSGGVQSQMLLTLLLTITCFLLLTASLVWLRFGIEEINKRIDKTLLAAERTL
jgi:heme exporter protein C